MSIARWNPKEAGGKLLTRGTRTPSEACIIPDESATQDEVPKLPKDGMVHGAGMRGKLPHLLEEACRLAGIALVTCAERCSWAGRSQQKP